MLLICTTLLVVFSVIASVLVGVISSKYEKSQFLKSYDLSLMNLTEVFAGHMESLSVLVGHLLTNSVCDDSLCTVLEASSYEQVPANTRNDIIALLSSICSNERYLKGALLYSPRNSMLYYYSDAKAYISHAKGDIDLPQLQPYVGTKLDNLTIEKAIMACTREDAPSERYYGSAITLYRTPDEPLGYFIPLFSTLELNNILDNYELDTSNSFRISDDSGRIYYCSNPLQGQDGRIVYANSVENSRYNFRVSYEVYRNNLPRSRTTVLIILFALIVTFFSVLLYYITYYLSNKNINGILNGMGQFSLENLSYRIARPNGQNEFTQIIDGFNKMCEELQMNVERSYVYELQQRRSELYALQTSINPHFLYNTLEMIRSQILYGNSGTASQMLSLLAKIYRTQTATDMFISIEEEVELCENFIILYQNRFQNFDYDFDVDEDVRWFAIPKNTLQPMLENYFVHGIKADKPDNLLTLSAWPEEENGVKYVHISLGNNGNSMEPEKLKQVTDKLENGIFANSENVSFALANVYSRLKIAFQNDCRLTIHTGEGEINFQIDVVFPARTIQALQGIFP